MYSLRTALGLYCLVGLIVFVVSIVLDPKRRVTVRAYPLGALAVAVCGAILLWPIVMLESWRTRRELSKNRRRAK